MKKEPTLKEYALVQLHRLDDMVRMYSDEIAKNPNEEKLAKMHAALCESNSMLEKAYYSK